VYNLASVVDTVAVGPHVHGDLGRRQGACVGGAPGVALVEAVQGIVQVLHVALRVVSGGTLLCRTFCSKKLVAALINNPR